MESPKFMVYFAITNLIQTVVRSTDIIGKNA